MSSLGTDQPPAGAAPKPLELQKKTAPEASARLSPAAPLRPGGRTFRRLLHGLIALLEIPGPGQREWLRRVTLMERDIVLPIKAALIGMLLYSFYSSPWVGRVQSEWEISVEWTRQFLWVYIAVNAVVAACLLGMRKLPLGLTQWLVFVSGLVDGIFLSTLLVVTGGYQSFLYWLFVGLIVRSAVSVPRATSQLILNFTLVACYVMAGVTHISIARRLDEAAVLQRQAASLPRPMRQRHTNSVSADTGAVLNADQASRSLPEGYLPPGGNAYWPDPEEMARETASLENPTEPLLVRLVLLLLMTLCSYGVQVLLQRQRQALDEAREFAVREVQLQAAGRLAAQFAHQIKNPLAIINNAAYSLQRMLAARPQAGAQVRMIQEEVEHADRIITQVMGYAQLSEGHVERLNLIEQLDYAIDRVFPPAAAFPIQVERNYASFFPPLVMLRSHASETFINVLQNAREALGGKQGLVRVSARCRPDYSIEVAISDDGCGIPPEKQARIFEAYYTTKDKGTGLGLATVKHNVELYGGTVRVESELGKGACFVLIFPARTLMNLAKTS